MAKRYNRYGGIEAWGVSEDGTHVFDRALGGSGMGMDEESAEEVMEVESRLVVSELQDAGELTVESGGTYTAPQGQAWTKVSVKSTEGDETQVIYNSTDETLTLIGKNISIGG